ncbi:MAG TPA: hypothetical protein VHN80_29590, partial [Kineosporiaceae bacterium]|nr:hypothetical protein [Kineosporiaceae bacterium]
MTSFLAPGSATGTAAAAASGALVGLGLTMILAGLIPRDPDDPAPTPWWTTVTARIRVLAGGGPSGWGEPVARRAGIAVLALVVAGLVTRWPRSPGWP